MTIPIARFISGYQNHRFNPFTGADMAVSKTEDHIPVPSSSPFCLQLLEVPRKEIPSTVVIYDYPDGITMTEVATSPTLGQYRVDYPIADGGHGTGMIEFNSGDAGKDIRVQYKATGSPVIAEFLDTLVSWPSPSPGANQGVIFKSGVPTWAYFPKRYFHEGSAIYHASGETKSSFLFRFKKGANDTKALLELKGAELHQGFYTELADHDHGGTTGANGGHSTPAHSHDQGSLAGSQPKHFHDYDQGDGAAVSLHTSQDGDEAVTISGSTGSAGSGSTPDHAHDIPSDSTTPKTYPDQLKVYIDGVDKTANILALLSGWTKLGDGTNTHVFVTAGTGELDITSLLAGGTMHEIMVTEPIAAAGGRVLLHLEVY